MRNMVLTGGGSCLAGVAERIEAELKNAARFHTLPTIAGQVRPIPISPLYLCCISSLYLRCPPSPAR